MKILCINGSPRRQGSSSFIIDKIIQGINREDIDVKQYCLGDMDINFCVGCKRCCKIGECFQNDSVNIIMDDLITSDIIIIASPSYWGDITGHLKVFFDRNTPYSDENPSKKKKIIPNGKKGISVAIRAGYSDKENIHIIESIEHYFGHLGIEPIGSISLKGVSTITDLMEKPEDINRAYELGRSLKTLV